MSLNRHCDAYAVRVCVCAGVCTQTRMCECSVWVGVHSSVYVVTVVDDERRAVGNSSHFQTPPCFLTGAEQCKEHVECSNSVLIKTWQTKNFNWPLKEKPSKTLFFQNKISFPFN